MRLLSCFVVILILITSCTPNNVHEDGSLEEILAQHNLEGCFGLFDNGQGKFTIYNVPRYRDSAFSPASTFKIVNSLIGIKTGKVFDETMVIRWDGITRPFTAWNRDLNMVEAFKLSAVSYYQEVARRIGKDTMQLWLDSLHYGNGQISIIDSFWLDNSLKIRPDEQLGLVKRLYFGQLPMDKRPQRIVKDMMLQESNANYMLSYKTGLGTKENGRPLGWVIGWIEENRHPYFFVLNVEGNPGQDITEARMKALKTILKKLGFFEGKK